MYATEKQSRGSDCSLIVVSLTTENNRIIHIRKAVAFSDFTFLLQTFCNLLYVTVQLIVLADSGCSVYTRSHSTQTTLYVWGGEKVVGSGTQTIVS